MRVAVLGAGNGNMAMAAHMVLKGMMFLFMINTGNTGRIQKQEDIP